MAAAALIGGVVPLIEAGAADAATVYGAKGGASFSYIVSETLPQFPCPACTADLRGGAQGAGHLRTVGAGDDYEAHFVLLNLNLRAGVVYSEPGPPYCPATGSATGAAVLTDVWAEGAVRRSSTPAEVGVIDFVRITLQFTYQRIGAAAALVLTSGSIYVAFHFGAEQGALVGGTTAVRPAGAASGTFVVDPVAAQARCHSPGPLPFLLRGDLAMAVG